MAKPIRIVLADDHPLVRAGIRSTLTAEPELEVVGEATDGDAAQRLCRELRPDMLLLDLNMPGPSPVDTVMALQQDCPTTQVLVLTAHDDDVYVRTLVGAGVAGYILKDDATEAVVEAVWSVMHGNRWFSRPVMAKLVDWGTGIPQRAEHRTLTEREREVLRYVVAGKTNQEIAIVLGLSIKTVEKQLGEVFVKLGVTSRVAAAVQAVRYGLV